MIRFTPEEQYVLQSGCKTVSGWYLGLAIVCNVFSIISFMVLIFSLEDIYYEPGLFVMSLAYFLDLTAVCIVFYVKFASFRKYANSVVGDTSIIINKFRNYSNAGGIVLSVFFFILALVPVILTETKVHGPLKRMLLSVNMPMY